jgi:hypothetical protein
MRYTLVALTLAVTIAVASLADGQQKHIDRKKLRKAHKDISTYLVVSINRQTLVVPMSWKEVFFRYDRLPNSNSFDASAVFNFARLYDLDTLRSLADSTLFRFGQPELAEFFRTFRPLSLERVFNSSPFDTVRHNRAGKLTHFPDMSRHYRMYFADSSRQAALDFLLGIPGVTNVSRDEVGVEF